MTKGEATRTILIGLFVVIACATITWMLLFLHPTHGDASKTFFVQFANIDKVTVGTKVTFAGRPVGEVIAVREVANAREQQPDRYGRIYYYELELSVDSSVRIFNTDQISVFTSGLLGERSIAIDPQAPKVGQEIYAITDQTMRAHSTGSVEQALGDLGALSEKAGKALDQLTDILSTNNEEIHLALKSLNKTLDSMDTFMVHLNETDLVTTVDDVANRFGSTMDKLGGQLTRMEDRQIVDTVADATENIRSITDALNKPDSLSSIITNVEDISVEIKDFAGKVSDAWPRVDSSLENFELATVSAREAMDEGKALVQNISQIVDDVSAGEGTLGRLLRSDDLYLRVTSIMHKLEVVMDDINHYGLLFHLDKGWQRQRVARVNLLHKISTPSQFRDYFEEEIDQITTSLSRVTMLLKKADKAEDKQEILEEKNFAGVFSDLLRQVEGLESSLKIYNSSFFEPQEE